MLNKLRLASYSLQIGDGFCSLSIKQNTPKISLTSDENGFSSLHLEVTLTAGIMDVSKAQPITDLADAGDVPNDTFSLAQKKLSTEIRQTFEKTKACNCDVFGVQERLIKHQKRSLRKYAKTALQNTLPSVAVRFRNVR